MSPAEERDAAALRLFTGVCAAGLDVEARSVVFADVTVDLLRDALEVAARVLAGAVHQIARMTGKDPAATWAWWVAECGLLAAGAESRP